ncbi:MAG: AAA family ATPase [bacterium]|nr:AAA family ATPase [bacterium]
MKKKKLPIGNSDFRDIIKENYYYVDKSLFIKEIIDKGDKILLIPRPRRFGKTLNLSMLYYFYTNRIEQNGIYKEPEPELFNHLAISQAGVEYTEKQGKYPVIFFTFKDVKENNWEKCCQKIKELVQIEYKKYKFLIQSDALDTEDKKYFKSIIELEAGETEYASSLNRLLVFLNRYYQERVVILVDEYDMPIHSGYANNYYDDVVNFIRNFLSGGLKDTGQYLEKSVLTGILRVAKESIFSGLNNPGVYTLLAEEFDNKFGFTEEEVALMADYYELKYKLKDIKKWYNGYIFGKQVIYNPWSILCYFQSKSGEFQPYWVNTSSNNLIEYYLTKGGKELNKDLEILIAGESLEKPIDENIVYKDVDRIDNLLWSFLLMSGYLKYTSKKYDESIAKFRCALNIPNEEVRSIFVGIVQYYFAERVESSIVENMLSALANGNVKEFGKLFRKIVLALFSYHDFGGEPEKVYHAFTAGLLVWLTNTHEIKSNRESGYGRYDICIIPKDAEKTGYVIEFKTVDTVENETVESAVKEALDQIEEKKYETELVERDIKNIKKLAIVFEGKNVSIIEA